MESSLKLELEIKAKNMFLRPENESARSSYETWRFGRLHTSRFRR
jgi:hypothetical protein